MITIFADIQITLIVISVVDAVSSMKLKCSISEKVLVNFDTEEYLYACLSFLILKKTDKSQ